jgi:putative flippase GtrA
MKISRALQRYLIIGVSVYLIELLIIVLAQQAGSTATAAVALSFWAGLAISFFLQKIITFDDKRLHHKILLPQLLAFSLLVLWNFGFTVLVTDLFSPPVPPTVTRTIALAITTLWNFYLYKTRIFRGTPDGIY